MKLLLNSAATTTTTTSTTTMAKRKGIFDYKLRDILPALGCGILIFNIIGYLGGFLLVDFKVRHGGERYYNKPEEHDAGREQTPRADNSNPGMTDDTHEFSVKTTVDGVLQNRRAFRKPTPGPSDARRVPLSRGVVQHSDSCTYTGGRAPNDGRWYNFSVPSYRFYAYSAIVDDRKSIRSDPVIRIIGLGSKPKDDSEKTDLRLYCLLHYPPNNYSYVAMNRNATKIGQGWLLNNEWVREYIFTCPMVQSQVPRAVAVVENQGDTVTSCMPVEIPVKSEKKEDFALCVQVAFDKLDPYRITEWLELQWILGVRLVGIYSMSLDPTTVKMLKNYVEEGFVELRQTDYIDHGPQQYLLHGSPVINDCVYRNINRFHYVIVIDFDEVIMPLKHASLRQLVDFLKVNYSTLALPPVNYIFYNNYFFLDLPPDTSESPYLTLLRYRMKVPVSPFGYSVKSIIDTQACLAMHNHFCWSLTEQFADRSYPHVVHYSIAVNQHYKKCHLNETECDILKSQATQDDVILKFRKKLKSRVEEKILTMLGHNI